MLPGITDMVRITDARMRSDVTGTIIMQVCPEAAVGGTISVIRNGDIQYEKHKSPD